MFFIDPPTLKIESATTESATAARPSNGVLTAVLHPHRQRWTAWLVLALLSAAMFFYGLNIGDFQKTEGLRAIIGANMLRTGNYVVPMLYDKPLVTKPPIMYAAIALCSLPFGEVTELSARLPSAIAATLVVLLMYWYCARQLGRLGGLMVAAATPCSMLMLEKSGTAEIDMLQVFWVAASLLFFFRAVEECESDAGKSGCIWWMLALLCVAGGVLTKWTAPLFFYAAALPFLYWRGRLRLLFRRAHVMSAMIGAAICFAWAGAVVHQVGWDTLVSTVVSEAEPRLSHVHHRKTAENILQETLVHPFKLLTATLPWSFFALLTLVPGFTRGWDDRGKRLLGAFHCWAWPNLLVMTILPDHGTRHNFPLFPAITALGALAWFGYVNGWMSSRTRLWQAGGTVCYSVGFGLLMIAACVGAYLQMPPGVWWVVLLVAAMGLWCSVEGVRAWREGRLAGSFTALVLTWVVLKVAMVQVYLPYRDAGRQPKAKAAMVAQVVPDGHSLYLIRVKDEGIMFYYRRPVVRLDDWKELPLHSEPVYCIVTRDEREWMLQQADWRIEREWPFKDTQDDSMTVLAVTRVEPRIWNAHFPVTIRFPLLV